MTGIRVIIVGSFAPAALERSYAAALRDLGCDIRKYDLPLTINRYCRFGRFGRFFNTFVPVEPWLRKANRDLVVMAREFRPSVVIVFGQNRVLAGALAQIRSMFSVRLVFVWPDTLINLSEGSIASLPLYDLVATYGSGTIPQFHRLGARNVEWVPLAGDSHMVEGLPLLFENERHIFGADISFIGQWRPEREAVMYAVLDRIRDRSVKIWGLDWGRRCRGKSAILKAWQGRALYENEYHKELAGSKISLNIIDETNYPAANMRFFEIPMAGGVQVCSPCPEMENEFRHGETIFYYRNVDDLCDIIHNLLDDDQLRHRVATNAHKIIINAHTYTHRARQLMQLLFEK